MSTITKEWLQKAISQHENMRDEIPFGLDEDSSNTLAALRISLASLEAEPRGYIDAGTPDDGVSILTENKLLKTDIALYTAPPAPANSEPVAWLWSHRKHPSEVSLVRPEDDERAEGAHWSGWSCQALYAAPPASAAMKDHQIRELVNELRDIAVEYHGTQQLRERIARTIRAAMLQGADGTLTNEGTIPVTQFKPVADLYGLTSPTGGETSFTFDAVEARDFIDGGWSCQEYVELERFQEAITNHTEDKLAMVNHLGDANEKDNFPVIPDGWVACSELMPEQFKAILAFNEYGEVWSGAYDRYWNFYCDNLLVEHVTHWMPLPAAPQQEA